MLITDQYPLIFEITAVGEQYINISWMSPSLSLASLAAQGVYYNLTISHGSSSDSQLISLNEPYYNFTVPGGALPCEVYNFSVTLAHVNNADVRTGCSVLLETILYSRNPLDTNNDLWTEVDLLGELILNITVKVSTGVHIDNEIKITILLAGSLYFNNIHSGAIRRYNQCPKII